MAISSSLRAKIFAPEPPSRPRRYYPNREPTVVLECGCLNTTWGSIQFLGDKNRYQGCDNHPDAPHEFGWIIIREATVYEYYKFYIARQSIPRRASKRTLSEVFDLPGWDSPQAEGPGDAQPVLF